MGERGRAEQTAEHEADVAPVRARGSAPVAENMPGLGFGNQAIGRVLHPEDGPEIDEVDKFLDSRQSLFAVSLRGTGVFVAVPWQQKWTERYTVRALSMAAIAAAVSKAYKGDVKGNDVTATLARIEGHGVSNKTSTDRTGDVFIDDSGMQKLAAAMGLDADDMTNPWRAQRGEAKMMEFALEEVAGAFDSLAPYFDEKAMTAANMPLELIRQLVGKDRQAMVEVARHHPAAAGWRRAYRADPELAAGRREPTFADFQKVAPEQWAATVFRLAVATRDKINAQIAHRIDEERKHQINEFLRPHEIKTENAAEFVLQTYDPTTTVKLPRGYVVQGGQTVSNVKGEPIHVLAVTGDRIIFQHLGTKRFYEQTHQGFDDELTFGALKMAGDKSKGAITLSKWVLGLAGAIFPVVRYGLYATDVINAAHQLEARHGELERLYGAVKVAYKNIDGLIPGAVSAIWDLVLNVKNLTIFDPMSDPDPGVWLKAAIRVALQLVKDHVSGGYVADAVHGILGKAWAIIGKAFGYLIVAISAIESTGISDLETITKTLEHRLRELGVARAAMIALEFKLLSPADSRLLVREIQDLMANGTQLLDTVKDALTW
jgi:hypothetical protein